MHLVRTGTGAKKNFIKCLSEKRRAVKSTIDMYFFALDDWILLICQLQCKINGEIYSKAIVVVPNGGMRKVLEIILPEDGRQLSSLGEKLAWVAGGKRKLCIMLIKVSYFYVPREMMTKLNVFCRNNKRLFYY